MFIQLNARLVEEDDQWKEVSRYYQIYEDTLSAQTFDNVQGDLLCWTIPLKSNIIVTIIVITPGGSSFKRT